MMQFMDVFSISHHGYSESVHTRLQEMDTTTHAYLDTFCTSFVQCITHNGFILSYAAITHGHVHLYTTRTTYTGLHISGLSNVATSVDLLFVYP